MFRTVFRRPRRTAAGRATARPQLEALEDRFALSIGSSFTVSSSSRFDKDPETASSANGYSAIVWAQEKSAGGGSYDIRAQLFDPSHVKVGSDIVVANSSDDEDGPEVAMDAAGNFAVVWRRDTGGDRNVFFALYDSSGNNVTPGGNGFLPVANDSTIDESAAHIGMSALGSFAVSYTVNDSDVLANIYTSTGAPFGLPIAVGAKPTRTEYGSRIDMAPNGRFAVAYVSSDAHNPAALDVYVARCKANGKIESRHKITVSTGGTDPGRDVAINDKGKTVVIYDHGLSTGNDNIYLKTITSAGISGAKSLTSSLDPEHSPKLGYNVSTGEFVVLYARDMSGTRHAFVREFDKKGRLKMINGVAQEHDLGADTSGTGTGGISLDGLDRYFVGYEKITSSSNHDMLGAFGDLSP